MHLWVLHVVRMVYWDNLQAERLLHEMEFHPECQMLVSEKSGMVMTTTASHHLPVKHTT